MSGWVGTTMAISLAVIAICLLGFAAAAVLSLKAASERMRALSQELSGLRHDLSPALTAVNRLATDGADIVELAEVEVREIIHTTRSLRRDVERSVERARERLADFEAVVEVVQEEVEETALDFGAALRTVRTGTGMIGRLRRLVLPRRR
jgi:uncharacterized protein YoxC